MKKQLAVAVSAALLAGSAMAANVTLYGRVDTGLAYTHSKVTGESAKDTLSMESGISTGSRWGLKGTEELGNGYKVKFVLENGFSSDTGKLGQGGRLFGREASVAVEGNVGTIIAGRLSSLRADAGSVGIFGGELSPFGSGWGAYLGQDAVWADYGFRYDNVIEYLTPKMGGVTAAVQYAMGDNGTENTARSDRYLGGAALAELGALRLVGIVQWLNKASVPSSGKKDQFDVTIGGNYNFGPATLYLSGQYFKNARDAFGSFLTEEIGWANNDYKIDGFGVNIGATAPLFGGTIMGQVGYGKGEVNRKMFDGADVDALAAQLAYKYQLSKRTRLYCGVGYTGRQVKNGGLAKTKTHNTQVTAGIAHYF